jgi:hypothetical protein
MRLSRAASDAKGKEFTPPHRNLSREQLATNTTHDFFKVFRCIGGDALAALALLCFDSTMYGNGLSVQASAHILETFFAAVAVVDWN